MVKKEKIDLFRQLKSRDYLASGTPALVKTGEGRYLTVEGKGAPGGEDFNRKIGALYGVAYTIKMTRKYAGEQDYVVGKLEPSGGVTARAKTLATCHLKSGGGSS